MGSWIPDRYGVGLRETGGNRNSLSSILRIESYADAARRHSLLHACSKGQSAHIDAALVALNGLDDVVKTHHDDQQRLDEMADLDPSP